MFVLLITALFLASAVNAVIGPGCTFDGGQWSTGPVACTNEKYILPYSIDLTEAVWITRVNELTIGGSRYSDVILTDESIEFPAFPLIKVTMRGFRTENRTDFPLAAIFPYSTKRTIQSLTVEGGVLATLSGGIFGDYGQLRNLTIRSTGLHEIDAGAFEIQSDYPAREKYFAISIIGNHLAAFDLAIFSTIASRIKSLSLRANGIQNLTHTNYFTFLELQTLDLSHNKLPALPGHVISSLPWYLRSLDLSANAFCPSDKFCRCCELAETMSYLAQFNIDALSLSCGSENLDGSNPCLVGQSFGLDYVTGQCRKDYSLSSSELNTAQWSSCVAPVPTDIDPEYLGELAESK